ncbi:MULTISPECIES: GNAT family N-acetyltransferase [Clostridium]|uniref:Putative ribosomal N-acetyltransferase YdaF n=2 Tax=Clostridium TaxID=1485 RepID=A0A151AHW2_9CLOT|nr:MULTISPECIES: GNAT family protein [Clostridium]KYH27165.1 putative ribosomal N-acetyltransferase YdaF [Clostridium colicanis DSM 13634]MBE6043492.1 GNAT family N-acetyltransferase [Clostridium thermopalmarium]PRR71631.1 putative ribosomal N-acetyltransferase YdaF [Clostridium thermopalmarium DSM 5974]PVZ15795.1 ribosomal-protein-alanine N-acetyltransferase [Clostridium thermopalmarium DSM 5974]
MNREKNIDIKVSQIKEKEYVVKDRFGINLGRIFIIELNKEEGYCSFRIKFYKNDYNHENELKQALELMITSLFTNMDVYKVSVIAGEDIIMTPFIELGFALEGIISNSYIVNKIRRDEFIFGIDVYTFKGNNSINILRLKGKNIELKILTPEDSKCVLEYYKRNKEYLEPFEPTRDKEFYTLEGQRQSLVESYKQFLNGSSVNFGIYKNKVLIGKIQVNNIVRGVFQNAFVGYSIDKEEQGKGYMKEALNLVLDYAFDDMELHRIEASTLVDNTRSQNVLKACGFKEIGISEKYLFINGKWRDHKIFYKVNDKL